MKSHNSTYSALRKEYIKEWRIWYEMNYRCRENIEYYVETNVCPDWQGPEGFINWLDHMGPQPGPGYIMDRINKLDDYTPANTHWVLKNDPDRRLRFHEGEKGRWYKVAKDNGVKRHTVWMRINRWGWDPKDAATMPPGVKGYHKRKV